MQRAVYRAYRNTKDIMIRRGNSPEARLFFAGMRFLNRRMAESCVSAGKEDPLNAEAIEWGRRYFERYARDPYRVVTDRPVALDSHDHKIPRGAIDDSSVNLRFNHKTLKFLGKRQDFSILDLGCAGGGMVRSFLNQGIEAIGIEGSDRPKKDGRGEWPNIRFHLFTADVCAPFTVEREGKPALFDCITAWEVMEHLSEHQFPMFFENIAKHLKNNGVFIASIDTSEDGDPTTGAVYHNTVRPKQWWLELIERHGFKFVTHPYEPEDFVRGHGMNLRNWHPSEGAGFHVVTAKN